MGDQRCGPLNGFDGDPVVRRLIVSQASSDAITAPLDEVGNVKTAIQPFGPHATWPNSVVQVDIPSGKERYTVDAQLDPGDVGASE